MYEKEDQRSGPYPNRYKITCYRVPGVKQWDIEKTTGSTEQNPSKDSILDRGERMNHSVKDLKTSGSSRTGEEVRSPTSTTLKIKYSKFQTDYKST